MCEADDSLTAPTTQVWPPPEGSVETFDDTWDDCELLTKYAQVEMQVKAQVEAFRSGQTSPPPPPPQPSSSINSPPPPPPATTGVDAFENSNNNAASSTRKKKRQNKHKRKGVAGAINDDHSARSQCSHGADSNQRTPSSDSTPAATASPAPAPTAATSAAVVVTPRTAQPSTCTVLPAGPVGSGVAPVYSWLLPNLDLRPDLLPPAPPPLVAARCSCSHFLVPTSSTSTTSAFGAAITPNAPSTHPYSPPLAMTNPNVEINTAALLRAWYEAGYAMGQAHAEQVMSLRPSIKKAPDGLGDGQGKSSSAVDKKEDSTESK